MKRPVLTPGWSRNELTRKAKASPSLDLRFAESKSLVDATTGQNLVTFTRASSGTYVGSDGLIKTATTNLLLRSEEFNEVAWAIQLASITSNAAVAPNGATTADKLVASGGSGEHNAYQSFTVVSGQSYTFSCYLKAAERTSFSLALRVANLWPGSTNQAVNYDLSNGTTSISSGTASSTIAAVGNGWYRCSITSTAIASGTGQVRVQSVFDADGEGVFAWGAQLEQSSTVGEYIPTTSTINSAPRFDHNPTTRESLGLLVEESRTNLQTQSEAFDQSPWSTVGGTTSTNVIAAPNSTTTADLLTENTTTGQHDVRVISPSLTHAASYTFSVFAKTNGRLLQIIFPITASDHGGTFNLTAGTATSVGTTTATIQAFPNGWYRCIVSGVKSGTGTVTIRLLTNNGLGNTYTGDGTSGIYLWGAQLEAGALPTSYIPTTSATVTRSADVASITGSNFSGWYRQDEGTVFSQAILPPGAFNTIVNINTTSNDTISSRTTATQANFNVVVSGTTQTGGLNISYSPYTVLKSVGCYALNDFALSANGATPVTDATGTVPVVIQASIGRSAANNNYANGTIARLAYWPQRLPNETLQTITQ